MLRELSIRKLNNIVCIEIKAKRYDDNFVPFDNIVCMQTILDFHLSGVKRNL